MNLIEQLQALLKDLFQWWITISPWEQGVRIRLGKHTKLLQSGIHLKLPIIDVVYVQPIRDRAQHIRPQTLMTKDKKIVSLAAAIQYKVDDILQLYSSVHNPQELIETKIQSAVAGYVNANTLEDIVPQDIEDHIAESLDFSKLGLTLHSSSITDFAVVRTYRFINGEIGTYTDHSTRIETTEAS